MREPSREQLVGSESTHQHADTELSGRLLETVLGHHAEAVHRFVVEADHRLEVAERALRRDGHREAMRLPIQVTTDDVEPRIRMLGVRAGEEHEIAALRRRAGGCRERGGIDAARHEQADSALALELAANRFEQALADGRDPLQLGAGEAIASGDRPECDRLGTAERMPRAVELEVMARGQRPDPREEGLWLCVEEPLLEKEVRHLGIDGEASSGCLQDALDLGGEEEALRTGADVERPAAEMVARQPDPPAAGIDEDQRPRAMQARKRSRAPADQRLEQEPRRRRLRYLRALRQQGPAELRRVRDPAIECERAPVALGERAAALARARAAMQTGELDPGFSELGAGRRPELPAVPQREEHARDGRIRGGRACSADDTRQCRHPTPSLSRPMAAIIPVREKA